MWPNNSFESNNGQYQNNFNQDDFQYSGPASPFGVPPGQPFFPQQVEDSKGQGFFQPELGLYNEQAFLQSQQFVPNAFSPPPQLPVAQVPTPAATQRGPGPELNARAAELKARLLKNRESRANSATPPVKQAGSNSFEKQEESAGKSHLTQEIPKAPETIAEDAEQEIDVDQLISQFSSNANKTAGVTIKNEEAMADTGSTNGQHPLQDINMSKPTASLELPVLRNRTNGAESATNGTKLENRKNARSQENGHANGFHSDASEGEIVEDLQPTKSDTQPNHKDTNLNVVKDDPNIRKPRDTPTSNPTRPVPREQSPPRRPQPVVQRSYSERRRDEPREEIDYRPERRQYSQELRNDRKPYPEPDRQPRRQESRDDDYRRREPLRPERVAPQEQDAKPPKPPALGDLLPHDEDLREWLEITGYHNVAYRSKILARRRKIAMLDAERAQLVEEMQAEESGGIAVPIGASMPPPPIPNSTGGRNEIIQAPTNVKAEPNIDALSSNKRSHSQLQDHREELDRSKLPRIDSRDDTEVRRPRSNGFDAPRRSSFDRRDEMDIDRPRFEGRGRSRERDASPGMRAYDGRAPPRSRGYEQDNFFDRRESPERSSRGAFEVRGGYRGRAYDPSYRGRGRGRARGSDRDSPEPRESGYGSRIANGRPYRDVNGFHKGSRGETRYFIVKSFNEDNVLNCIRDSIWTTQVQNGEVFKEAFETCKNVILVFSINKSRAFQGYARMESLPGSVAAPEWQNQINWESAGAFRVKWLVVCATRFQGVGHLKNSLNENLPVLIGKDGQEIEENCGSSLIDLIDKEVREALTYSRRPENEHDMEDYY